MNILITGITGFTGSHLAELLLKDENNKVFGTVRGRCRQTAFIDKIKENLTLLECDLTDYNSIQATLEESHPDVIYHLGAQTFVPTSWRAPQETMNTNVLGTLNLLEAIRKSSFNPKILIAGSSEEYGKVEESEVPIKETNPLRPLSPYAVSKVTQDLLGYQYFESYGMKIVRTRAFNLIGPRSGEKIVTANFAKQIVNMEKQESRYKGSSGKIYNLEVGNLDSIRDFNDIRDVVVAYAVATTELCRDGEVYNISTGEGHTIREIIEIYKNLTDVKMEIVFNENRNRPSDVPILIGDSTKFREETGWTPLYHFQKSLKDVLEYWRNQ
jgi:GDP-4-dehydro-6-deoxy-D-mannose reductase